MTNRKVDKKERLRYKDFVLPWDESEVKEKGGGKGEAIKER